MMKKRDEVQMTPEEKELLRRLMETPGAEREMDFFEGMSRNTPPPEFFMRGKPEPRFYRTRRFLKVSCFVAAMLVCSSILATFMVPDAANADRAPFRMLAENIKNGFLVMNPASGEVEPSELETKFTVEEEAELKGKRIFPNLLTPAYIPEGYRFDFLKIAKNEEGSNLATSIYKSESGAFVKIEQYINVVEHTSKGYNLMNSDQLMEKNVLYFQKDKSEVNNILSVWNDGDIRVTITGSIGEHMLEDIYNGLQ